MKELQPLEPKLKMYRDQRKQIQLDLDELSGHIDGKSETIDGYKK